MRRSLTLLSLALLLAACSSHDSAKEATAAPAKTALPAKLDCANILPDALRTKYLAGVQIVDHPESVAFVGECSFAAADGSLGTVTVSCSGSAKMSIEPSIAMLKKTTNGATDLPGVGRGAVTAPGSSPGATFVTAWDDDSNCSAILMLPKGVDAVAFAKDLLAYLPPK